MTVITSDSIRDHMDATMDRVCHDHAPMVITRENGHSVVLMSLEDYESLEETAYLLRSPANAARLMKAMDDIEAGRGSERSLLE